MPAQAKELTALPFSYRLYEQGDGGIAGQLRAQC